MRDDLPRRRAGAPSSGPDGPPSPPKGEKGRSVAQRFDTLCDLGIPDLGLIVGKFYPPHAGHHHLIEVGLANCRELHVLVGDNPAEAIPARDRIGWLRACHPAARFHRVLDRYPEAPAPWAEVARRILGRAPDVVFTSEVYGEPFAAALGCRHHLVDLDRRRFPVSGTAVRRDPLAAWGFLRPPVRAALARRIVLVGAESAGKTTLAARLAAHFETIWVPEYGRAFTEALPDLAAHAWGRPDFERIAAGQLELVEAALPACNKALIEDTDLLATAIWQERYTGEFHHGLMRRLRPAHLYLLCSPDTPFVQDGYRDGEQIRGWMDQRFEEVLSGIGANFVRISGGWEERFEQAIQAVERELALPRPIM